MLDISQGRKIEPILSETWECFDDFPSNAKTSISLAGLYIFTILNSSKDLKSVYSFCSRALWLSKVLLYLSTSPMTY